jgi:hypothetical protein
MNERTLARNGIRWLLLLIAAFGALAIPDGDIVFWAFLGAVIAVDGPWRSFVPLLVLLVAAELVGGLGIGALSLPFAVTVLVIAGGSTFLMLGPWPIAERWHIGPAVRAWCVAVASGILMAVAAAAVSTFLYGYGIETVAAVIDSMILVRILIVTAIALMILRRIDMPFRFPVLFGT